MMPTRSKTISAAPSQKPTCGNRHRLWLYSVAMIGQKQQADAGSGYSCVGGTSHSRTGVLAVMCAVLLFVSACTSTGISAFGEGDPSGGSAADGFPEGADMAAEFDPAQPRSLPAPPPRADALTGSDQQRLGQEPQSQTRIIHPAHSPLAPGAPIDISTHIPHPGEQFHYNICTVAYSFTDEAGTGYAITASHCGREGDLVWAGQANNRFQWPAEPIGSFIYSDLYTVDSSDLDIAIIELNANAYDASVAGGSEAALNPMATAIADRLDFLPEHVCKNGRITGITCGDTTAAQALGKLNTHDGSVLDARSARAALCATTGDSGGPVYAELNGEQVIVGLVSGTTTQQAAHQCNGDEPVDGNNGDISVSYTPATEFQRIIGSIVPQAATTTTTW